MTQEFVTLPREVVKQALEALDAAMSGGKYPYKHRCSEAIDTLRAALDQPQVEQEPVAWMHQCNKRPDLAELSFSKREPALAAKGYRVRPLIFGDIAHPQLRRKPLTEDEIDKLCPQYDDPMRREMWIIGFKAAHGIK